MTWTPTSQFVPAAEPSVWQQIESKYGKPFTALKAPEDHRFKMRDNGEPEFRVGQKGERVMMFLDHSAYTLLVCADHCPRLILEPIPAPTPKRYVIVLEETGEVRCPRDREPYVDIDGLPWIAIDDWTHDKRTILRVVSREAK